MAQNPHANEGTATDGVRARNGLNRGKLVSPGVLNDTCVSGGQHFRCEFLGRVPGKEDNTKAPRIWCKHFCENVVVISRKQQRPEKCKDKFNV
jgi:hypothetical protein